MGGACVCVCVCVRRGGDYVQIEVKMQSKLE